MKTTINPIKLRAIAKAKEATFMRGNYQVSLECSLDEYAAEFDPRYSNVNKNVPAEVTAYETKNGNILLKVLFHTVNNMDLEMKLSKKSDLEEDDLIDINSLKFLFIEKGDKCDWVVDGKVYVEPKPAKKTSKPAKSSKKK